ncbi:MAG: CoA-binding protein [Candidatus Sericytochromatia bacterium]
MNINKNIKQTLEEIKTIAVVGLSSKPERASNGVSKYMMNNGYKIYPVNPVEKEILGEISYPDLKSLPIKPDLVNVFRSPETVMPIVDEAIELGIKKIWFQLGVVNEEAIKKALDAGIEVVVDKCIKVEHMYL